MKRLSFLWLLLLATYSVSFANTYSDDNNTDLWSDWEESLFHQYRNVFYKDSIYYGFYPEGSNPEETASVAFYLGTIYLLAVNSTLFLCDNQQLQVELSLSELIFVST